MSGAPTSTLSFKGFNPNAAAFTPGSTPPVPTTPQGPALAPTMAQTPSTPVPMASFPVAGSMASPLPSVASLNINTNLKPNAPVFIPKATAPAFVPRGPAAVVPPTQPAAAPAVSAAPVAPATTSTSNVVAPAPVAAAASPAAPAVSVAPAAAPAATADKKPALTIKTETEAASTPVAAAPASATSSAATTPASSSAAATPSAGGGWQRGVTHGSVSANTTSSGKLRYDKAALVALFSRALNRCPAAISKLYPSHLIKERLPLTGHVQAGTPHGKHHDHNRNNNNNEPVGPHPDEVVLFSAERLNDERMFHHKQGKVEDENDPEIILKKANLILNQLSVEKFDRLSDRFMQCGIDRSEDLISRAVDMIVMKAQLEEHLCFMYADLCRKIIEVWTQMDEQQSADVKREYAPEGLGKFFRGALLEVCKREFALDRAKGIADLQALDIPKDDKDEKILVYRRRYVGHMRFIGEVFKQDVVRYSVMLNCLEDLVKSTEEDSLTCLCRLLQTIGIKLEELAETRSKVRDPFEKLFESLAAMSEETDKFSSRIRFMFKDILDLRKNNWVNRIETEKAGKLQRPASMSNVAGADSPSVKGDARKGDDEWHSVGSIKNAKRGGPALTVNVKSGPGDVRRSGGSGRTPSSAGGGGGRFDAFNSGRNSPATGRGGGGSASSTPRGGAGSAKGPANNRFPGKGSAAGSTGTSSANTPTASSPLAQLNFVAPNREARHTEKVHEVIMSSFKEYYRTNLLEDVVQTVQENSSPLNDNLWCIVKGVLSDAMDHKSADHEKIGSALAELKKARIINNEHIVFGFSVFLSGLEEIIIDSPRADIYLGTIIASCWVAQVFDSLSFVFSASSFVDPEDSPGLPACLAHVVALAAESIANFPQGGSKEAAEAAVKTIGVSQDELSNAVGGSDSWKDYLAAKAPVTQALFGSV